MSRATKRSSFRRSCGTLPTNLFESGLFGYKQGAFTDAKKDKPGRITLADGGTIFFDEIGELPVETQVKLLRLLQEREYDPLGGVQDVFEESLRGSGIQVISWVSGCVDDLLDLFLRGQLVPGTKRRTQAGLDPSLMDKSRE